MCNSRSATAPENNNARNLHGGPRSPGESNSRVRAACAVLKNRGARIRTGDLCDPNAALYRTEPRPGCSSCFHQTDGVGCASLRSVGLPPVGSNPLCASCFAARVGSKPSDHFAFFSNGRSGMHLASLGGLPPVDSNPLWRPASQSRVGSKPSDHLLSILNGRGGIRTHAGFRPHDFQSCALSHSAIRPRRPAPRLAQRPVLSFES